MSKRSNVRAIKKVSRGPQLVAQLRKGTAVQRDCVWPGEGGFPFVMVPLTCEEVQLADTAALSRYKKLDIEITIYNHGEFQAECNVQSLAYAIRDADDPELRLFASGDELRKALQPDERNELTTEFIEMQEAYNPDIDDYDDEMADEIRQTVKKKDRDKLRSFGSNTLSSYLLGMADPPAS